MNQREQWTKALCVVMSSSSILLSSYLPAHNAIVELTTEVAEKAVVQVYVPEPVRMVFMKAYYREIHHAHCKAMIQAFEHGHTMAPLALVVDMVTHIDRTTLSPKELKCLNKYVKNLEDNEAVITTPYSSADTGRGIPFYKTLVALFVDRFINTRRINVFDDASVGGTLTVTGNSRIGGTLHVAKDSTIGGNLLVEGSTTVEGGTIIAGDFTITGNNTVDGNESVGGTFNVAGLATLGGGAQINGNLNVTGTTTLAGPLNAQNGATITGNLSVSGTTTLNNLNIGGTLNLTNLTVTGISDLQGATNLGSTLDVAGASTFNSDVTIDNAGSLEITTGDLEVTMGNIIMPVGDINLTDGDINLSNNGSITLANGDITLTNGNLSVGGTSDLQGATTVGSTLDVTGNTTITGLLQANGGVEVTGTFLLNGIPLFAPAYGSVYVSGGSNIIQDNNFVTYAVLPANTGIAPVNMTVVNDFDGTNNPAGYFWGLQIDQAGTYMINHWALTNNGDNTYEMGVGIYPGGVTLLPTTASTASTAAVGGVVNSVAIVPLVAGTVLRPVVISGGPLIVNASVLVVHRVG
jgi:predicted acyltransferase (DUF342 family)